MKNYNYFIENLDNEKIEIIQEKITQIPLVKEVNISQGEYLHSLTYTLGDNDDEYAVFVKVTDILQQEGADIAFEDENVNSAVNAEDVKTNESGEDVEVEEQAQQEEGEKAKPRKKGFFSRIPDFTTRLAEIVVAFLLYFIVDFSSYIAAGICLVLACYEIFYDTVCDLTKKKISDNLFASIAIIFAAFCGHLKGAFFFAIIFSLLKILNCYAVFCLKKKTEKHFAVKSFETEEGDEIDAESLKEGIRLNVNGYVYFNCEAIKGEAEVKKAGGDIICVKEGDLLQIGDVILNKQYLIVKSLEKYSESAFKQKREIESKVSEQLNSIICCKKQSIIYIALILTGLIYCFISPLFYSGAYMSNLTYQGIKGVLFIGLCAPLIDNWASLRKELLRYVAVKETVLIDFNKLETLYNTKTVLYDQEVLISGEELHSDAYGVIREIKDLGVQAQTAFGKDQSSLNEICDALRLKNRIVAEKEEIAANNKGALLLEKEQDKIVASVDADKLIITKEDSLRAVAKAYSASKRAKLLKKLSLIFGGVFAGAVFVLTCLAVLSFTSAVAVYLTLTGLVGAMNLLELVEM